MANKRNDRAYHWATILYPESCKENWKEILMGDDGLHISFCVSPLHDKDVNLDGEIKKAHYHLIFIFDTLKSFDQIKEICDMIGAVTPQRCLSLRGAARYLCHLDNPEKYQYNVEDVFTYAFDVKDLFQKSYSEKHFTVREVFAFCRQQGIFEFADLMDYCAVNQPDWFDLLLDQYTLVVSNYLTSLRHSYKPKKIVDCQESPMYYEGN